MTRLEDPIRARVLELASELGFDSCRVARCDSPKHANEFNKWLGDGAAGEMEWMERGADKRRDPQLVLPGSAFGHCFCLELLAGRRSATVTDRRYKLSTHRAVCLGR